MGGSSSKARKPQTEKLSSQDKAVLDLKVQRDRLKQYQKKIESVLAREDELARKALKEGHKNKAILILKKKKYQQDLLAKTDNQILTLEHMATSIEYKTVELTVVQGIRNGNSVLKELNEAMSLEDVEKLMEDTADAVAYQNQLSDMLANQYASPEDEDDILKELQQLQELDTIKRKDNIQQALPTTAALPAVEVPSVAVEQAVQPVASPEPILEAV